MGFFPPFEFTVWPASSFQEEALPKGRYICLQKERSGSDLVASRILKIEEIPLYTEILTGSICGAR